MTDALIAVLRYLVVVFTLPGPAVVVTRTRRVCSSVMHNIQGLLRAQLHSDDAFHFAVTETLTTRVTTAAAAVTG